MANTIRIKRSTSSGVSPSANSLVTGELAINTADAVLFTKNEAGVVSRLPAFDPNGQNIVGSGATSRGVSVSAQSNGSFALVGDAQLRTGVLRCVTSDDTERELSLDGMNASNSNTFVLPNYGTMAFEAQIVARRADAVGGSSAFSLSGCISRDSGASSTSMVNFNKNTIGKTNLSWDVRAAADVINGRLCFFVLGENGKTIRWVATIRITEVTC
jgi:hypothetical protein